MLKVESTLKDLRKLSAIEDFRHARRKAALQQILDGLRRRSKNLLPFEEVRQTFKAQPANDLGFQEIPLEAIVGSVNRYEEYTRNFLPKYDNDEERWVRVKAQIEETGLNPISVYKLGEAYFVNDGNHRVSVARQMDSETIPAYVTEVKARVDISPADKPHELICKARYADFLEKTNLDELRPKSALLMTFPGQYRRLLDQIETQRYILGLNPGRDKVPLDEAVTTWYDRAYLPLVRLIWQHGLQRSFPDLTEADLYVMVIRHRDEMLKHLEWHVVLTAVTTDLVRQKSRARDQIVERFGDRLLDAVTPDALESGPAPGKWREERLARRPATNPFSDILVVIRNVDSDKVVIEHAAIIAKREQARLMALLMLKGKKGSNGPSAQETRKLFENSCEKWGIRCEIAVEPGPFARKIVERAAWTDLLALSLIHKSGNRTKTGFGSKFNRILQRSPRPVLILPEQANSKLDKALLAYDGSPKSDEALYLATYMANNWSIDLVVVVAGEELAYSALHRARSYLLSRDVTARYVSAARPANKAIINTADDHGCNYIIMGGYGYRPLLQLVLGSTVTKVARRSDIPVLVCR